MSIEAQLAHGAALTVELMTKRVMLLDVLCVALAIWSTRAAAARLAQLRMKPKKQDKALAAVYSPKEFRRPRNDW